MDREPAKKEQRKQLPSERLTRLWINSKYEANSGGIGNSIGCSC
ncbi:hypothetical protein HanRHA438_Chr09g0414421 [Helianthus annuus]|nr:hypothetical protein HanRHA438_Chr09g0414421 [Helianthus annuus]